jgi:hypothetical protein
MLYTWPMTLVMRKEAGDPRKVPSHSWTSRAPRRLYIWGVGEQREGRSEGRE